MVVNGWKARAACVGRYDKNWDDDFVMPDVAAICGRCPVRSECLMEAIDRRPDEDVGIWGGTSVAQRRAIRRGDLEPWDVWNQQQFPYEIG